MKKIALSAAALSLFLVLPAAATSLVQMSLQQLTQASSNVIQGRVVSQVSQWNAAHTEIVTLTTVAVGSNQKGNTPSTIVVEQLGGTVGHYHVNVPGAVHFFAQSKYVLFLEHAAAAPAQYHVVGMIEGAYRIYQDSRTGQERVINPMGRYSYAKSAGHASAAPLTMPLSEFQQKVSSEMAKPLAIPAGTSLPLLIRSTSFNGVGRILIEAQTTMDLFPNSATAIPAGSLVDGSGTKVSGHWVLHWTAISVRGKQARISATSQAATSGNLQGERFIAVTK